MKRNSWIVAASLVLFCLLIPGRAHADAIGLAFLFIGCTVLLPFMLFIVLVEGKIVSRGLAIPYRQALWVMLSANLFSLLAGIPVKLANSVMYQSILPVKLGSYFRLYPFAVLLGTLNYFVVTVLVEYVDVAVWCRKKKINITRGQLMRLILVANCATYVVLAPLYYWLTKPQNDIRHFTDDSDWAETPSVQILYVNSEGHLFSIQSDGTNQHELIPDKVRDYQYMPNQGLYLYRNGKNELCLFRETNNDTIVRVKTTTRFLMDQVACDSTGGLLAYKNQNHLCVYNVSTGRSLETDIVLSDRFYEIAWSNLPNMFYLRNNRNYSAILINPNGEISVQQVDEDNITIPISYGRYGIYNSWSSGNEWGAIFDEDEVDGVKAYGYPYLGSYLDIVMSNEKYRLADNPGLLKFGRRRFIDICLIHEGKELVFDDGHDIYLLDVDKRKVGWITDGSRFIVLNERYRRKF